MDQRCRPAAGLRTAGLLADGDRDRREPPAEARDVRGEALARRLARATAPDLDGPRHVHLAELLREALDQPAEQRQLGVDPDVRHAAGAPAVEAAVQDDVGLLVLTLRRVVLDARVAIGRRG